jgi:hypothetical protein
MEVCILYSPQCYPSGAYKIQNFEQKFVLANINALKIAWSKLLGQIGHGQFFF